MVACGRVVVCVTDSPLMLWVQEKLSELADRHNERVLETPHNPVRRHALSCGRIAADVAMCECRYRLQ